MAAADLTTVRVKPNGRRPDALLHRPISAPTAAPVPRKPVAPMGSAFESGNRRAALSNWEYPRATRRSAGCGPELVPEWLTFAPGCRDEAVAGKGASSPSVQRG